MYRAEVVVQRRRGGGRVSRDFKSKRWAYYWVRVKAWWVDFNEPSTFLTTDCVGNKISMTCDTDITWHVFEVSEEG